MQRSSGVLRPSFGEFELVRPWILGALLDAAAHGLRAAGFIHLTVPPRMADFALWAMACETGLWPAGTFTRAYAANRKAAIEGIIDMDPIAACVRELMSERSSWTGSAAEYVIKRRHDDDGHLLVDERNGPVLELARGTASRHRSCD